MTRPCPEKVGLLEESVWDYPRPPRIERASPRIRVFLDTTLIAETARAERVLETSHPPVYYVPREDVRMDLFEPSTAGSHCEWKGQARYFSLRHGTQLLRNVAWSYAEPEEAFRALAGHLAFYLEPLVGWVGDERATPQPGRFYGGWVTSNVKGPFKGGPGSQGF